MQDRHSNLTPQITKPYQPTNNPIGQHVNKRHRDGQKGMTLSQTGQVAMRSHPNYLIIVICKLISEPCSAIKPLTSPIATAYQAKQSSSMTSLDLVSLTHFPLGLLKQKIDLCFEMQNIKDI